MNISQEEIIKKQEKLRKLKEESFIKSVVKESEKAMRPLINTQKDIAALHASQLSEISADLKSKKILDEREIPLITDLLSVIKNLKGEPFKFEDFTKDQLTELAEMASKYVSKGKDGINGKDGKDGKNGVNGKDGKDGLDGRDGIDGKTPEKGVDYFTKKDIEDIVKQIPKSDLTIEVILDLIKKQLDIEYLARQLEKLPEKDKLDPFEVLKDFRQIINSVGNMYGGGSGNNGNGGGAWGTITGLIENQTDLQDALDLKANVSDLSNYLLTSTANSTFLKLDGSNDPITGDLAINAKLTLTPVVASGDALQIGNNGFIYFGASRFRAVSTNFQFQDSSFITGVNIGVGGNNTYFNSGNVGVGTTSPTEKLHVVGNAYFDTSAGELTIQNTGSSSVKLYGSGSIVLDTAAGQSIGFETNGTRLGTFFNGNFGIGTTNPSAKLAVSGLNNVANIYSTTSSWDEEIFSVDWLNDSAGRGTGGSKLEVQGFFAGRPRIVPAFQDGTKTNAVLVLLDSAAVGQQLHIGDANAVISRQSSGSVLRFQVTNGTLFQAVASNQNVLVVKAAASQTSNLIEIRDSSDAVLSRFNQSGQLFAPYGEFAATSPSITTLVVKGAASHSGNLQSWQNNSSTVLSAVTSAGHASFPTLKLGTGSVGAAPSGQLYIVASQPAAFLVDSSNSNQSFRMTAADSYYAILGNNNERHLAVYHTGNVKLGSNVDVNSAPSSRVVINGSFSVPLSSKTSAYTATTDDHTILCNATTAAFTITLPTAVGISGRVYVIKKVDASVNAITVDGNGTETIDGSLTYSLNSQWQSVTIQSDGTNWVII
jgi:hypothetical protein